MDEIGRLPVVIPGEMPEDYTEEPLEPPFDPANLSEDAFRQLVEEFGEEAVVDWLEQYFEATGTSPADLELADV